MKKLIFTNLLSKKYKQLIEFYINIVGLQPINNNADPSNEKWYGFNTGKVPFAIEPMSNRDKYTIDYQKGNPYLIQFEANSLQELTNWTESLEKHHVNIGQRILQKSYGTVTTFTDPDGNLIELVFNAEKYPENEVDIKLAFVNLLSETPKNLITFYKDVVGLTPLDTEKNINADRWYGFETGNVTFAIEPMSNRERYNTTNYNTKNPILIQFFVKSLKDLKERTNKLEVNKVEVFQKMIEKYYGIYSTFIDPDGNLIELLYKGNK